MFLYYDTKAVELGITISFISPPIHKNQWGWKMKTMLGHEEIQVTVVLKNFGNPGSVVAQRSRFPGGVGGVF